MVIPTLSDDQQLPIGIRYQGFCRNVRDPIRQFCPGITTFDRWQYFPPSSCLLRIKLNDETCVFIRAEQMYRRKREDITRIEGEM